jgi:hypothetical protein
VGGDSGYGTYTMLSFCFPLWQLSLLHPPPLSPHPPPSHTHAHNPLCICSSKPIIAICAVRTGCGKSQTSHYIIDALKAHGKSAVLVRHPMPYGELVFLLLC